MNKFLIALCISAASAVTLEQKWGVKDLTDEVVAFNKLSFDDQEKSITNDSIKEAEAEAGHKIGEATTSLPEELQVTGKARKFDNSALLD